MAISVGDAVLKLGVDTKDLDKGMQGIGNTIKSHQKAIGLGMTAAGGAILAAGALSIKTFAEMGDEVQKMALKTGLSTEALSELRHAAETSGTSLEGIEKGVKRMASTLLDAEMGLSTSVDALNELGLSVEDFKGLSPEEAFIKFMEAIASVEDPLKRSALAQDIFGKSGVDLLPMMENGSQGLAKLRQEAHDLGIVFDQEAANKAAEFSDAMDRMDKSVSGVKMAIAEQLIPALMPLIDNITAIIKQVTTWAKEHPELTKVIVIGTAAFGALLTVLGLLLVLMPGITAATAAFGITLSAAIWPITLIVAAIAGLIAIGVLLWQNWDTISAKATAVWGGIVTYIYQVVSQIGAAWNSLITYFNNLWQTVSTIFQGIADAMWAPIRNAIQWIINYIETLRATLRSLSGMFGGGGGGGGGGGSAPVPEYVNPWDLEYMGPEYVNPWDLEYMGLQHGAIAMRPLLAKIAEREPEAVIPLSKLGGVIGGVTITGNNFYVREEADINKIGDRLVQLIRLKTGVRI